MNAPVALSSAESRRVVRLVEAIQHVLGHRIVALIGISPDGDLCVIPQPGHERDVMLTLKGVRWDVAVRSVEEHAP